MHAFFRTLVARLLASTFLAACAPGDDGGPPTSTTATDTGATDADASDSGATDASDADATGATGRPDVVVETVRVSVCAMACTTAADCCANGISGCPGDYPMNWSCEDGYCAFGGCSSHDDCQSPFVRNLECHPFGGVGTCIDPCDRDDDCPGSLTCSGRADDGTAVCAGATGCRSDEDCGGLGRCDASGACVCDDAGDCTLTATTPGGWGCRSMEVVVDPVRACYDRQQNGGETGVDCGGPCGACPGAACDGGGGCASGVCAGGACVAPTCTDGARNGRETGVDCGGTCPNDCPSCHDEIRNQDESDVDCGGQCGACGLDQRCAGPADCGGAPCVAGVCGCPSGRHLCDGECVRDDDASRCGAQCEVCRTSSGTVACVGGECVATCYGGYHDCGGTCEADDSIHACGPDCVACPTPAHSATRCVDGACEWECDPNYRLCGDSCKAIDSPGACGDACVVCPAPTAGGYATCDGGVCGLACSDGYRRCPGDRCVADGLTCNGRRRCEAHAECAYDEVCGYVYSESETVCSAVCAVASDCAGGEVCARLPGSLQIGFCQTARVTGRPDGSACTSDSECKSTLCHFLDKVCGSACARPTDCAHCGIDSGPGGTLHYRSDCGSARLEAGATCPRNSACESMACEDVCRQLCVSNGDCPEGETCQVNLGSTQPADGVLPMLADDAPVAHHDASAACYFASIGPVPFG
ncbi:MAG: hypothetical protein IT385_21375, partial [Deltaproteobacteria bacterium]|nr:hypothetical protein [Deltaproteobacteria bacterium]